MAFQVLIEVAEVAAAGGIAFGFVLGVLYMLLRK